jgi:hypothetical protein
VTEQPDPLRKQSIAREYLQARGKLDQLNWERALDDVAPFLERPQDRDMISPDVFKRLLS